MSVAIEIDLMTGRYEAAGAGDRDAGEWPPHPARVFCALVAGARTDEERAALRWLERQPPPVVHAAAEVHTQTHASYVVTNARPQGGKRGSQFHPGRANAERVRMTTVPSTSAVTLVWLDTEPDEDVVAVLDALARRVPYLGRSTGVAALRARIVEDVPLTEGQVEYVPASADEAAALGLRVAYDGYLDSLGALHAAGRPAWEDSRLVGYRRADAASAASADDAGHPQTAASVPSPSVYTDLVMLRFRGVRPDGRLTTRFTTALRRALMKATEDPLPAVLHGHGADDRPHITFLAIPDVGHEHADGHLLGMAVALPDVPDDERRRVLSGLLHGLRRPGDDGPEHVLLLRVPGIGEVELEYSPGLVRPWGMRPERWRTGSTRWKTATPMVLDRYPKRGDVEREVRAACRRSGLPQPVHVDARTAPTLSGAVRLRPSDLPERARGRLYRHVELVFDRPVSGPLLLGAGRYLGVGLFTPVRPEKAEPAAVGAPDLSAVGPALDQVREGAA